MKRTTTQLQAIASYVIWHLHVNEYKKTNIRVRTTPYCSGKKVLWLFTSLTHTTNERTKFGFTLGSWAECTLLYWRKGFKRTAATMLLLVFLSHYSFMIFQFRAFSFVRCSQPHGRRQITQYYSQRNIFHKTNHSSL